MERVIGGVPDEAGHSFVQESDERVSWQRCGISDRRVEDVIVEFGAESGRAFDRPGVDCSHYESASESATRDWCTQRALA